MRAFILRPFGTKYGINFDEVHRQLISPALTTCDYDIQDSVTGSFVQAGKICIKMFQLLVAGDVVVADISIHDANVFYELGVRHALRPQHTLLLFAKSKKN